MTKQDLRRGQVVPDAHRCIAPAHPPAADQPAPATHSRGVSGTLCDNDHEEVDLQLGNVAVASSPDSPTIFATTSFGNSDGYRELRIWAELFNGAQLERIAMVNRAERGGVFPGTFDVVVQSALATEKAAQKQMIACYERVVDPAIREWVTATHGIGDHSAARLLGHLGDPLVATPHWWEGTGSKRTLMSGEPYLRSVAQLWSLCGHGDPQRKKQRGMSADEAAALGSPTLKMIVWNIATGFMKQGVVYREVYDEARAKYADRVHADVCVRCGPSGKPAQPGTPWRPAHQHAAALRYVGKTWLKDLWQVANGLNPTAEGQTT